MGNHSKEYKRAYYQRNKNKIHRWNNKWRKNNLEKVRAKERSWREKNLERARDKERKNKYGMEPGTYKRMWEEQDGECIICNRVGQLLIVDHDHKTNKVRGLLCQSCNSGLGLFKDSIELLNKAINYLNIYAYSNSELVPT